MKIVSAGAWTTIKAEGQTFTTASWNGIPQPGITLRWGSYASLYERHLWVYTLVNKIAFAAARLPLKVYARGDHGSRVDAGSHPYGTLLARPHPELDPFLFWLWVESTITLYGEAFLVKQRDNLGRPVALIPWHPTGVVDQVRDGRREWKLVRSGGARQPVARRDLVHFRMFNPHTMWRGVSPLEPLRATLENEWAARESASALWANGARPSMILKHPGSFKKDETIKRIRDQVAESHGGASNWAKPLVLEEAMDAQVIQLSNEELQYIDARRLNREECCAAFDVPPPVVHILDRATFSNITEQMRSMYRDTMAPKLKLIESTLEVELRDGRMGADGDPDFGDEVYAEFLMDEVLRGDFEARSAAYTSGVNAGWLQPAEVRRMENLPFVEGSDKLLVNSTLVPIQGGDGRMTVRELAEALQKIYLSVGKVITPDEARQILNREGADLIGRYDPPEVPVRSLMGRLSRKDTLADVDPAALVAGLDDDASAVVLAALAASRVEGDTVDQFKTRLRALEAPS